MVEVGEIGVDLIQSVGQVPVTEIGYEHALVPQAVDPLDDLKRQSGCLSLQEVSQHRCLSDSDQVGGDLLEVNAVEATECKAMLGPFRAKLGGKLLQRMICVEYVRIVGGDDPSSAAFEITFEVVQELESDLDDAGVFAGRQGYELGFEIRSGQSRQGCDSFGGAR